MNAPKGILQPYYIIHFYLSSISNKPMKKNFLIKLMAFAALLVSCTNKASVSKNVSVDYLIEKSYLILPIEENGKEVKMTVHYPDRKDSQALSVRLAQNKIDYWVKLDVKNYKGKTVSIDFEGLEKSSLGIDSIKASDHFDFYYNEIYRPIFHFTPEYGWTNDPNGMVYLDGEYHLFYQYNPYGNRWGNMHWGHAVSTDLVSWTYLPTVLAPDSLGAIFSGSSVIDVHNTAGFGRNAMVAIYTSAGAAQTQSIAYSTDRGRTFKKYEKNPVIHNPGIQDFRDPKVFWYEPAKRWIMTLATKQTVTFYASPNLKEWTRLSDFGNGIGSHGGVWECPDMFPMTYQGKTKWVLLVSVNPGGPNGGSATQYFIGSFDGRNFKADPLPYPLWVDYGRDNYAGVTWANVSESDSRRIFLGWMSNWDYANDVPSMNFRSAMTVPRELSLVNNGNHLILASLPIKEINKLHGKVTAIPNQLVQNKMVVNNLLKKNDGAMDIEMTIIPQNAHVFGFAMANSKGEMVKFTFDLHQNNLQVDRNNSGLVKFHPNFASIPFAPILKREAYKVRLLVDKASSEIFVNDGETVLTNLHFPSECYNSLSFFTADNAWSAQNIRIFEIR